MLCYVKFIITSCHELYWLKRVMKHFESIWEKSYNIHYYHAGYINISHPNLILCLITVVGSDCAKSSSPGICRLLHIQWMHNQCIMTLLKILQILHTFYIHWVTCRPRHTCPIKIWSRYLGNIFMLFNKLVIYNCSFWSN